MGVAFFDLFSASVGLEIQGIQRNADEDQDRKENADAGGGDLPKQKYRSMSNARRGSIGKN
jgi:hypothetical protein